MNSIAHATFSTCIQKCTIEGAAWFGRFYIVGTIPASCYDTTRNGGAGGSKSYATEAEALAAILADSWIKASPAHPIQMADCSHYVRATPAITNAQALRAVSGVSNAEKKRIRAARLRVGKDLALAQKVAALRAFDSAPCCGCCS